MRKSNRTVYGANATVRPTRFEGMGYRCDAPGLWRFYDTADGGEHAVGYQYASKAELLADLERYATEYGCKTD